MVPFLSGRKFVALLSVVLLYLLTRLTYDFWPYPWPDEALFSSPAASLAENSIFATPVLAGLIPGMERATLWNSPLFMLLLSGLYFFTGESLVVARALSFVLALFSLFLSYRIALLFFDKKKYALAVPLFLVLDLTFIRSANTGRMDMLTLLFVLFALYYLLTGLKERSEIENRLGTNGKKFLKSFFKAGICTGLAGLSHPIAVILAPVILIFSLPSLVSLFAVGVGAILSFSGWLFYILPNYEIFLEQFLSQLQRKSGMFQLWGGDTGGIFVVYSSQYGGSFWIMLFALLLLFGYFVFGAWQLYLSLRERPFWKLDIHSDLYFRMYLSFLLVSVFVLTASEAWYAIYIAPWFLFLGLYWASKNQKEKKWFTRLPILFTAIFLLSGTVRFLYHNLIHHDTPRAVSEITATMLRKTESCSSVYLRVVPDPYFIFRKSRPGMEIYEFVPGKLRFSGKDTETRLTKKYDKIHCFLIDANDSWEPILAGYLQHHSAEFAVSELEASSPLKNVFLWERK